MSNNIGKIRPGEGVEGQRPTEEIKKKEVIKEEVISPGTSTVKTSEQKKTEKPQGKIGEPAILEPNYKIQAKAVSPAQIEEGVEVDKAYKEVLERDSATYTSLLDYITETRNEGEVPDEFPSVILKNMDDDEQEWTKREVSGLALAIRDFGLTENHLAAIALLFLMIQRMQSEIKSKEEKGREIKLTQQYEMAKQSGTLAAMLKELSAQELFVEAGASIASAANSAMTLASQSLSAAAAPGAVKAEQEGISKQLFEKEKSLAPNLRSPAYDSAIQKSWVGEEFPKDKDLLKNYKPETVLPADSEEIKGLKNKFFALDRYEAIQNKMRENMDSAKIVGDIFGKGEESAAKLGVAVVRKSAAPMEYEQKVLENDRHLSSENVEKHKKIADDSAQLQREVMNMLMEFVSAIRQASPAAKG